MVGLQWHKVLFFATLAASKTVPPAPTVQIAPGVWLPMVALGTGSGQHGDVAAATALWVGSTGGVAIDTAFIYKDEPAVAEGLQRAAVARAEVFLETKIVCGSYADARSQITSNLEQLGVAYADLTLIHFPSADAARVAETWRALEDALTSNQTRAIGVSNFDVGDLETLALSAKVWPPAVNQCELSVSFHDDATIAYCASHGIHYQAYSPLCGGFNGSSCTDAGGANVLSVPEVLEIAQTRNRSTAQIGLRWVTQQGHSLATSIWSLEYMEEDLGIFDFDLTQDELATLSAVYQPTATTGRPESIL